VRSIFIDIFNTQFHQSQYRLVLRYTYFAPEIFRWDPTDPLKTFTFVDGGMTPYNNADFLLFRMATHPLYRPKWKTGEKNMLLISVGTGMADDLNFKNNINRVSNLAGTPGTLMHIDRELRDRTFREAGIERTVEERQKAKRTLLDRDLGRAFLCARYNADLSPEGLDALGCNKMDAERVQKLDEIEKVIQIGLKADDKIKLEHLGSFAPKAVATS
jgi:uncharacterized protein